jgi:hypothetical protein
VLVIAYLDQVLDLRSVIWLFPVVFMLHDLEEIIVGESWLTRHKERVKRALPARLAAWFEESFSMKTAQFAVAVTCIFLVLTVATILAAVTLPEGTWLPFFLVCLHVMFLNVFTHTGQSLAFRGYTPGVATALVIVLPYTIYAYYRLLAAGLISWPLIYSTLPYVPLVFPVLLGAHRLGRKLRV